MAVKRTVSSEHNKNANLKLIGPNLSFSAQEAYKRLRTNLDFSLAEVEGCRVIGFTSSIRGEGKSLTSINMMYSLAETGSRVILIEGDMRLPTMSNKLSLTEKRGLSDAFSSAGSVFDYVQQYSIHANDQNDVRFDILTAGTIPPNPAELLGSQRMREFLEELKAAYDYVIFDLPPIIAVTDALIVSKMLNGIVFVVRSNYSEKNALAEAMRQLSFSGVRVLGCVFNGGNEDRDGYLSRYRYRYGKGYYHYGNVYRAIERNTVTDQKPREQTKQP